MDEKEKRIFTLSNIEIRAGTEGNSQVIEGYASIFNSPTMIGDMFQETIAPGAFAKSLAEQADIRALFNHNWDYVLGRTRSGTLTLEEDDKGLKFRVTPPDTSWAKDLMISMQRGDINQCSFGFQVVKDSWNWDVEPAQRTVQEVKLYEISIVSLPAYEDTEAYVRDKFTEQRELHYERQKLIRKIEEALKR
ncbi:HK97 family phage prohead protease [Thermaerobacillus caldiproteolyticus]|uniref:HK97 family phage prohead protease n=1 Tax=Thermaerobacillus caldiproteolyticus TaxID=247480 RepID=UPI00188DAE8F|nr:HK97 family phage prohead protease [Anoxybacillus caldiproteolyticus]QPA31621.1 HK97 family phage prohead protease [Anoxybacillus caldiproteolyticus]